MGLVLVQFGKEAATILLTTNKNPKARNIMDLATPCKVGKEKYGENNHKLIISINCLTTSIPYSFVTLKSNPDA